MGAGLFTLQQCALIIGLRWATGDVGLRKRVLSSLHLKKQSLAAIRYGVTHTAVRAHAFTHAFAHAFCR